MAALLFIAGKREVRERKALLALHATAARGDVRDVRKLIKDDPE